MVHDSAARKVVAAIAQQCPQFWIGNERYDLVDDDGVLDVTVTTGWVEESRRYFLTLAEGSMGAAERCASFELAPGVPCAAGGDAATACPAHSIIPCTLEDAHAGACVPGLAPLTDQWQLTVSSLCAIAVTAATTQTIERTEVTDLEPVAEVAELPAMELARALVEASKGEGFELASRPRENPCPSIDRREATIEFDGPGGGGRYEVKITCDETGSPEVLQVCAWDTDDWSAEPYFEKWIDDDEGGLVAVAVLQHTIRELKAARAEYQALIGE